MKIAIRIDDVSPGMDKNKFNKFYGILDEMGIHPLLGVVPYNEDKNLCLDSEMNSTKFFQWIKQLEESGCVIAMHGYNHCYSTKKRGCFPLNSLSEFAGLSYEAQKKKIEDGKKIFTINGIDTDIFMAPAHSFDKITIQALQQCGFKRITDGFGKHPYIYHRMLFYPISFIKKYTLKARNGYSSLVFHTNTMSEEEIEEWKNHLIKIQAKLIPYSEYLKVKPIEQGLFGKIVEIIKANIKYGLINLKN